MMMKCFVILALSLDTAAASNLNVDTNEKPVTVTVYFIRHAESEWNKKKAENKAMKLTNKKIKESNKGKPRAEKEKKMVEHDNKEADAPLTETGRNQVGTLRDWWKCRHNGENAMVENCPICKKTALSCLLANKALQETKKSEAGIETVSLDHRVAGDVTATQDCESDAPKTLTKKNVIFGTSNLKRAIETLLIFIRGMREGGESASDVPTVHIVSALQETSFGADASTKLKKTEIPFDGTHADGESQGYGEALTGYPQNVEKIVSFDGSDNLGDRNRWFNYMSDRFPKFCEWVDKKAESGHETFVISGHSSWLMDFFVASFGGKGFGKDKENDEKLNLAENILRMNGKHNNKELQIKLANASMIKFQLEVTQNNGLLSKWWKGAVQCVIKPKSTQLIFGDWQVAGSCESSQEACGELKTLVAKTASPQSLESTCPV